MVNTPAVVLFAAILASAIGAQPQTPVIGIYTQHAPNTKGYIYTYIAASYVKYLEMSGAQVVPLFYNATRAELNSTLHKINGVLFPGGDAAIDIKNSWTKTADFILQFAKQQNDEGKVFPVWGTCLGHQLLSYLTAEYASVLQPVTDESPKVNSIQILKKDSDIFLGWQDKHFQVVSSGQGVLYFSHHYAVYTKLFNQSAPLSTFWHLVAKTTSSAGEEFVSAMQAKNYPFYSSQFHPEKNPFEWRVDANRTVASIEVVQLLSNFFVSKARLSPNRYTNLTEMYEALIYNYPTVAPAAEYSLQSFQQIYLFNESN